MTKTKRLEMVTKFKKFIADQGLTVQFLMNMKNHGRNGIVDSDYLFQWIHSAGISPKSALFVAFYWTDTPEHKEDSMFWNKVSLRWKRCLENKPTYNGRGVLI